MLNAQLFKELSLSQDHCRNLNVELKGNRNKIRQQEDAIKIQEENIKSLQEQLGVQLDIIKRLEKSSILSNTQSFGYQNMTEGMMNPDHRELIDALNQKINALDSYLADQTSKYHSEQFKNEKLISKIKEFQRNEEVMSIQILQLETFKEEKDDKISRLKEKKRLLQEELIRKEVEIKNIKRTRDLSQTAVVNRPGIIQLNRLDQSHLNMTQNEVDQFNQSYSTNIHETTIIRHQRKGINIMGSQQKWSHELDIAVNKLRESKSGFMQRSFILHQNMQEIQKAHHKRMQTLSSNELTNSNSEFNQQSRENIMKSHLKAKLNKSIIPISSKMLTQSQNQIFADDEPQTQIQKMNYLSPDYKSSVKKIKMSRMEHSEESKFDINDHISPRKSNVYSNFNEDDDDDDIKERYDEVVDLDYGNKIATFRAQKNVIQNSKQSSYYKPTPENTQLNDQHQRDTSKASNLIGVNESDLMEFDVSANRIAATLVNQTNMEYSLFEAMNQSQRSIQNTEIRKSNQKQQKQNYAQNQGYSSSQSNQKLHPEAASAKSEQRVTVTNINITKNMGVNNFLGEGQFVQSFQGSSMQENSNQRLSSKNNYQNRNQTTESTTGQRKNQTKVNTSSKNQTTTENKVSLQSYESIQQKGVKGSQKMIFEMPSSAQKLRISPQKKVNFSNLEDEEEEQKSNYKRGILKVSERSAIKNNNYNELNCITVDQEEIESEQIIYQISNIDPEEKSQILQDLTSNNIKLEEQISRLVMQQDILIEYFVITVLAFILKHPKRTSLQQIDKLNLYNEAQKKQVPFFKWHKWIEMRMIEIYHEKKRQKKAELRKTLFDPKSWFGKVKINSEKSKIEIIEDHFQTI